MNDPVPVHKRPQPAKAPPPQESAAAMFSLLTAAHVLEGRLEDALGSVGVSMAKLGVLGLLAEAKEPLTLSDLAARQACVRSNMTQLIDRLEADGLVQRVDDPADRRVVRAMLTPLGKERHAAGSRQVERVQAEFAAALSEADRRALERVLGALR